MMTTREFLRQLRDLGIQLWDDDGYLGYRGPDEALTPAILAQLKARKTAILQFLQGAEDASQLEPIPTASHTGHLPLSFAQERLWFQDQLQGADPAYNIPFVLRLRGSLDMAVLEKSLQEIVQRHESLRTIYRLDTSSTDTVEATNAGPTQIIQPASFTLTQVDLTGMSAAEQATTIQRLTKEEATKPFQLNQDLMLRVTLLHLGVPDQGVTNGQPPSHQQEYLLLLTMHHIASDVWSMGILQRELVALYRAFANQQPSPLPPLSIQYADYAIWHRQQMATPAMSEHLAYWRAQLADAPAALEIPTDRPRPPVQTHNGAAHEFTLPPALSDAIKELSRTMGGTLFTTLLAAFNVLLYRYSGQTDILVGGSIAGRNRAELEPLIGFFVNNLIYRTNLADDPTFPELVQQVHQTATAAYTHQDCPFDQLVNELHITRDPSRNPLAQVRFAFHQREELMLTDTLPGVEISLEPQETYYARYDLNLRLVDQGDTLIGWLSYNTDLFHAATIIRMADHFQQLLASITTASPTQTISQLAMLTEEERQTLLVDWNQTQRPLPLDRLFHELFEEQVARTPEALAAVAGDQTLTYRQLNQAANQLAHLLVVQGVGNGTETIVALLARRNLDFLTAMLAIFKAGGVYLPLDPRNPADRQRQLLAQSRAPLVLVADEFALTLEQAEVAPTTTILSLEQRLASPNATPNATENLPRRSEPGSLAYVIYTSGSTGMPKGAMVEQRGMLNHLYAKVFDLTLTTADQIAQTASQSFDISVWQFLAGLLVGGTVHIYHDETALNPTLLLERVATDRITIWETVPSLMRALLDAIAQDNRYPLEQLRWLIPTGEALPPRLANQWLQFYPQIPLLNAYGPTECSDDVTHYAIHQPLAPETVHTPIGRPVVNMQAYILDTQMQPTPIGVPGELWIGGVGVGRGYLNDPERTTAAFRPDPFAPEFITGPEARLYKTGDRARYLPAPEEGLPTIEFLGRLDFQTKIRGFRIELGEIEFVLHQHPAIRECLVVVHEEDDGATKQLVAYLVATSGSQPSTVADLRRFVQSRLPDYMVPAFFIMLETMPLTANGKIDRRALPAPVAERSTLATTFVEPESTLERYLAEQWQRVLKTDQIGLHDNFFEIGGDSIRGAILMNQLQQQFQEVLYVVALFDAPTLGQLAAYLEQHYPAAVARVTGVTVTPTLADVTAAGASTTAKVDEALLAQFRQLIPPLPPLTEPTTPKNPRAVFVLSAPRSGSTLFRVMLGGHPQLFSPPELDLLSFNTMAERATDLGGRFAFRLEGLIRAVMELLVCDADAVKALLGSFETRGMPMPDFYRQLQHWVGPTRLLVDKTPIYALDPQTLRRAEDYFEEVHYIHLLRHPAGMIRSFEEARTDQVFFRYEHDFSARQLAEMVWTVSHQNILAFLQEIPAERQHRVTYEALVTEPEETTRAICAFLDLPYAAAMAHPYADKEERMTDGIYSVSKMLGDPKFHTHRQVDPTVADRWREQYTEDFIGEPTWRLAQSMGYTRPTIPNSLSSNGATAAGPAQSGQNVLTLQTVAGATRGILTPPTFADTPLVALEPRGEKRPFFCVHDAGGSVYRFYALSRALGTTQPFYGLQAVGINGEAAPLTSVEAMATHYLAAIQSVQPEGPYQLGGYSFGGLIAYEMARQLLHQGKSVAQLVLLDSHPLRKAEPDWWQNGADALRSLQPQQPRNGSKDEVGDDQATQIWQELLGDLAEELTLAPDQLHWLLYTAFYLNRAQSDAIDLATFAALPRTAQLAQLRQHLQDGGLLRNMAEDEQFRGFMDVFRTNQQMRYQPTESIAVSTLLVRPSDQWQEAIVPDPTPGWQRVFTLPVTTVIVPGDHFTMLTAPHVSAVADHLAIRLSMQSTPA